LGRQGWFPDAPRETFYDRFAALVDREALERSIAFHGRNVRARNNFFFIYPGRKFIFPTLISPIPTFAGQPGPVISADAMAEVDLQRRPMARRHTAGSSLRLEHNPRTLVLRQLGRVAAAVARLARSGRLSTHDD